MGYITYLEGHLRMILSPANDNVPQFPQGIQFGIRYLAEIGRISRECKLRDDGLRDDGLEELYAIARAAEADREVHGGFWIEGPDYV